MNTTLGSTLRALYSSLAISRRSLGSLGLWMAIALLAGTRGIASPFVGSVVVGPQSPNPVVVPGAVTYLITVNRGSGTGSFGAHLSLTGLVQGMSASFSTTLLSFAASDGSQTATLTITTSCTTPSGTRTITVKAVDSLDSTDLATTSATVAVVGDTTPPQVICPPAVNVTCAGAIPARATSLLGFVNQGGSASDNCSGVMVSWSSDVTNSLSCPNHFVITRTYVATDLAGNTANCTQRITVNDVTPPLITSFPADLTVNCAGAVPSANNALVSASDNCGGAVTVTHDPDVISNQTCPNRFTISRTYHATDACGNVASQSQTITVNDVTSPLISNFPTDLTVDCVGAVPPANDTLIAASDNCGGAVTISHDADVVSNQTCPNRFTISRTYHATDVCGNVASQSQTISVNDVTSPLITSFPADLTVTCAGAVPPADDKLVAAIDNCGGTVTVTHDADVITPGSCAGHLTIRRTYHAVDACGNIASQSQLIAVDDETAPTITAFPSDATVSCATAVPSPDDSLVSASDNCGGAVTVTHDPDVVSNQTCPNRFTVTRTYHATDVCGNVASQSQTVTVNDVTSPLITTFPTDLTVDCAGTVPPADDTLITASDNCGGAVTISHDADVVSNQTCANRFTLTRTYHATDACGNVASQSQTITVNDLTSPLITSFPTDLTVDCAGAVPLANDTLVAASDNCGGSVTISHDPDVVSNQTCPNRFTATRTYHATDVCGNVASQSQTITVNDVTSPLITSFPADLTVTCAGAVPPADDKLITASDNCGGAITVTHDADVITPGSCAGHLTIRRTYHAVDACGNVASQSQLIAVDDETAPTITAFPSDATVSCAAALPSPDDSLVRASDNCGGAVTVTHDPDVVSNQTCPNRFTLTRTYHATDACGNVASQSQTFTVNDVTSPLISSFLTDLTVDCAGAVPPANDTLVAASDNCGGSVTISHDPDVVSNQTCPNRFTVTRTYHATDACGNVASQSQTITVNDLTSPLITSFPTDLTVDCAGAVPPANDTLITASDNCGGSVTVSHDPDVVSNQTCPNRFTVTRTYHATDACGNAASQSQTITVNDVNSPLISSFPTDLTVSCAGAVPPADDKLVAAIDNCGGTVTVTHDSDIITAGGCAGHLTIRRTYHAADACGNVASQSQLIAVDDETAPTITAFPSDATVSCAAAVPSPDDSLVSASDNCGGAVTVIHDPDVISNQTCPNRFTLTRTYHASDACGNLTSRSQTITVNDNEPPVLTVGAILPCYASAAAAEAAAIAATSASDNCTSRPVLSASTIGTCNATVIVTGTDECGNVASVEYATRIDSTPPVMVATVIAPAYRSVADAQAAALAATTATDACSGIVAMTVSTVGTCNAVVTVTATDSCGNASSVSYLTRLDNTPPVLLGCPSDASYAQSADVPPPATVTASDGCDGSVTVTFSQFETNPGSPGTNTITRTWTAVDGAGNTATCSQTILVNHGEAPSITLIGANPMLVVLGSTYIDPGCTASDSLGQPLPVAVSGTVNPAVVGTYLITYTATDAYGDQASATRVVLVQYELAGISCNGSAGRTVLPPINPDGSSIFQQGRTIPVKFRVFDATCRSIGTPGVVSQFNLVAGLAGAAKKSRWTRRLTASDAEFVWDPQEQDWIYNLDTSDLKQGSTYVYQIGLNDGTAIQFQFSLK